VSSSKKLPKNKPRPIFLLYQAAPYATTFAQGWERRRPVGFVATFYKSVMNENIEKRDESMVRTKRLQNKQIEIAL
jgi:hypothetical protein